MIFYIWAAALFIALALYCRQVFSRFSKYGVKTKTPIPLLGNISSMIFRLKHQGDLALDYYNDFPGERFVGKFDLMKPIVFLRDLELVKKVAIKDYEYFLDHRHFSNEDTDKYFDRSLFSLRGQEWKDMRSTLSPAFTSSKMKNMVPFIVEVGNQMIASLKSRLQKAGTNNIEVDVKDITTRYANDVIASCAFGVKVDSLSEPSNHFYTMGAKATHLGLRQLLKFSGYSAVNLYFKKYEIKFFDLDVMNFLRHLVIDSMEDREARNIVRPDMIHLLMEAKKGKLTYDVQSGKDADAGFATVEESTVGKRNVIRDWSEDDLVAQAAIFFAAGFDTVSTAMSFLLYELALNPDVQERLAQEIKENDKARGGKFDYTSIQKLKYLDMVVSESLRLWPPALVIDRLCTKDYNLGKPNDKATEDFIVRAGEIVNIPVVAFHHNPEYFPNPKKFDPERFSEENRHKINPIAYMPFGIGPRNCIGSRFALCEVKVMVYQMLQHFEVLPSERTRVPGELSTSSFNTRLKGGHWLRVKARN